MNELSVAIVCNIKYLNVSICHMCYNIINCIELSTKIVNFLSEI